MTDEQAKAIVAMLCGAWPTAKQNNPQTLQVYVGALRPLGFDHAFLAADRLVRTSRFWPAAAEIVEAAQRVADEERIEAEKAAPLLPDGRGGANRLAPAAVAALRDALAAKLRGEIDLEELERRKDLALRKAPEVAW